jgi:hypothetical protein
MYSTETWFIIIIVVIALIWLIWMASGGSMSEGFGIISPYSASYYPYYPYYGGYYGGRGYGRGYGRRGWGGHRGWR